MESALPIALYGIYHWFCPKTILDEKTETIWAHFQYSNASYIIKRGMGHLFVEYVSCKLNTLNRKILPGELVPFFISNGKEDFWDVATAVVQGSLNFKGSTRATVTSELNTATVGVIVNNATIGKDMRTGKTWIESNNRKNHLIMKLDRLPPAS